MATIKSYTDIEQSKKLAEILPLDSADIHYKVNRHNNESKMFMIPYSELGCYKDNDYQYSVCAWSLVALLGVLPKIVKLETLFIETSASLWHIGYRGIYIARADNLLDACYEIILKLHELKML